MLDVEVGVNRATPVRSDSLGAPRAQNFFPSSIHLLSTAKSLKRCPKLTSCQLELQFSHLDRGTQLAEPALQPRAWGEIYILYGSACPGKERLHSSYYQEGPRSGHIHIGIPYMPRSSYTR